MQKRFAAARMRRSWLRVCMTRGLSLVLCFVVAVSAVAAPSAAHASDFTDLLVSSAKDWLAGWTGQNTGVWNPVDPLMGFFTVDSSKNIPAAVNKPQNYYTGVTSSVVDKSGNVTNYYRGGDTTNTNIIDSYNKTFNTIYNTTNNSTTNQYSANVKLENFLNQYTTNNVTTNNTYSANFKSWYYDNTTNNYNYNQFTKNDYTQNNLYYNQDNSRYYISIDNSTDEYYLVDVQYSPTFVTVNYTYNTTNNNYEHVGDVTNIYYYELTDGRNSSTLTAAEVAGIDFGYDVVNYELVTDDPNTLSLQHFDGDYTDSSSYNRTFYSQNRSFQYVDSGDFGKAVLLPTGAAAGVQIPNLSSNSSLSFDFRVYFNDISSLGIYFGDTNIFQEVVTSRSWTGKDSYTDDGYAIGYYYAGSFTKGWSCDVSNLKVGSSYDLSYIKSLGTSSNAEFFISDNLRSSTFSPPDSYLSAGFDNESSYSKKYGWMSYTNSTPVLFATKTVSLGKITSIYYNSMIYGEKSHYIEKEYRWSPSQYVLADFAYDSYKNQWVSMRITISGGKIYYFVNGDLVGSGTFTKPTADKFYIKSSGTVYLDELRVTTGSLSSTSTYTPSSAPYDTNKVLALPDNLAANTIYVQHTTPIVGHRIGGVRPSNPATGFLYIPLYEDNTGGQPQLYDGSNWVNVTAMVYDGQSLKNALGFQFSPVGASPDVDIDAKPERPTKPSDNPDSETCTHDWLENTDEYVPPTCTRAGTKSYTCSKCEKSKAETIPLLDHDWMVKVAITNQYDETGELVVVGFTIYECTRCQEQYKSVDGTAPPPLNPGGSSSVTPGSSGSDGEKDEGFLSWLFRKIGELLGAVGDGVIGLLRAALEKIFDGLIALVEMIMDKLAEVVEAVLKIFDEVPKLFSGFLIFLSAMFPFLPSEIMLLLTFGIAAVVFVGIIKAIRR